MSSLKEIAKDSSKFHAYEQTNEFAIPKGVRAESYNKDARHFNGSLVNKLHLMKLGNEMSPMDRGIANMELYDAKTFQDLCINSGQAGSPEYDIEDFIYNKRVRLPINRLITLRRYSHPTVNDIFSKAGMPYPDIARMVTHFDQDTNKLEDILTMSFGVKWKELNSVSEQASSQGDQSGFSGMAKKVMSFIDGGLAQNDLRGENALNYDPQHDQNKVYGPVDSISETHIRDVGLNFDKEFSIQFDYEMRSIGGRTPEYAFKDILANILAVTYNNANFWGGARYFVGERPSNYIDKMKFMAPSTVDEFLSGATSSLRSALAAFSDGKGGMNKEAIKAALTNVVKNGFAIGLGKILDSVGRPSIMVMNSLLNGEPVGQHHLTIGNPTNPIMVMGNLMMMGTEITFPTDDLSFGDFPDKMRVVVKLKPGMPLDKAGIESCFNYGKGRIYHNPKKVQKTNNTSVLSKKARSFFGHSTDEIKEMALQTFDYVANNTEILVTSIDNIGANLKVRNSTNNAQGGVRATPISAKYNTVTQNRRPL